MTIYQKLKWLLLAGITESIGETPVNRFQQNKISEVNKIPIISQSTDRSMEESNFLDQAKALAKSATTLSELYAVREKFEGCSLKKTAAHTLNGTGIKKPRVLCLLNMPDKEADKEGSLLANNLGLKLKQMIGSIGLDLEKNTYVSTLVPWRTPGDRKPTDIEYALCRPFWEREIELLKPEVLILFGSGVSEQVLNISALSKARGLWHTFQNIATRVCISPQMVLQSHDVNAKLAWQDLQQIKIKLDTPNT